MSYEPTKGVLPGEQWIPSNGTDGWSFIESWCSHCERDKALSEGADFDDCDDDQLCEIVAASFRGEAVEWRVVDGGELKCIAFVEKGQPIPCQRCVKTVDMFDGSAQ